MLENLLLLAAGGSIIVGAFIVACGGSIVAGGRGCCWEGSTFKRGIYCCWLLVFFPTYVTVCAGLHSIGSAKTAQEYAFPCLALIGIRKTLFSVIPRGRHPIQKKKITLAHLKHT